MSDDGSNGYEHIASIYVAGRGTRPLVGDAIGAAIVQAWAHAFPPGATILDLGCGPGEPSTRILQEAGLAPYAVDASSAMVAAFRERFPGVPIEHGWHDRPSVAVARGTNVRAIAARCRPDVGGRSGGRGREPLLLRREAVARRGLVGRQR